MTLLYPSGPFAAITDHFERYVSEASLPLDVQVDGKGSTVLTAADARTCLYGDAVDPCMAASIWQAVVRQARREIEADGPWRLLLVWLALPRLTGTVYRIATRLRANRADAEAEIVLGLLEALATADPESPKSIDTMLATARRRAWTHARSMRRLVAVEQIEPMAEREARRVGEDHDPRFAMVDDGWSSSAEDRVYRHDRLGAQLRFTVPSSRTEGERIRALAEDLDLMDVLQRAQRGKRRRVGTVSLRPRGRRR